LPCANIDFFGATPEGTEKQSNIETQLEPQGNEIKLAQKLLRFFS